MLSKEQKYEIFGKYSPEKRTTDTGSAESQIALFTQRINDLTEHLKVHPKDNSSRLGLLKLVGQRKRFLAYLQRTDITRYRAILAELGLRK